MPTQVETETTLLTRDQQQAIAEVELARFRRFDRLHKQARHYPGRRWLSFAFFVLGLWVAGKSIDIAYYGVAFSLLALGVALVQIHIGGINRRIDAIVELLDPDPSTPRKKG